MKHLRWLAVPVLVLSSALADGQDVNLKGKTLCVSPDSIDLSVDSPGKASLTNLAQRLRTELLKQFDQSKVSYHKKDACDADYQVYVTVGATSGPNRGYITRVEVDDNVLPVSVYKEYVIIWEDFYYGWSADKDQALEDYLFQQGQKSIKALAQAWHGNN